MRYFGVDLGTTYSCVSMINDEGKAELKKINGFSSIPSVIRYSKEGIIIGQEAKNFIFNNTKNRIEVIDESKRYMGSDHYWEVTDTNGNNIRVYPQDIAEEILRYIKNNTEVLKELNDNDFKCVVTVPASYNDKQKSFVKEAAKKAGLGDVIIRPEPTAAAASYIVEQNEEMSKFTDGFILVFDLGGGTLDVSLIDIKNNNVRNTIGFPKLGGKDWDNEIINDMINKYAILHNETPDSIKNDKMFSYLFTKPSEELKMKFTDEMDDNKRYSAPPVSSKNGQEIFYYTISRSEFENKTKWLMDLAMDCIDQLLVEPIDGKKITPADIKKILLVGGSSRMDQVKTSISNKYNEFKNKIQQYEADKAISKGAAYFAEGKKIKITDVLAHTIGIKIKGGLCSNIIYRLSPVPIKTTKRYQTSTDNQRSLNLDVYINTELHENKVNLSECANLGKLSIDNLPDGLPKGTTVEVTLEYNENGELIIYGKCSGVSGIKKIDYNNIG